MRHSVSSPESHFVQIYHTPPDFDDLAIISDGEVLLGLKFLTAGAFLQMQTDFPCDLPIFSAAKRWLDLYFSGHDPGFTPQYRLCGATPFRTEVATILQTIPFGATLTYGEIAHQLAEHHHCERMSAQAVGGAVGWNPLCLIIPCHRVLGAGGTLTGYSSGLNNKINLLKLEKIPYTP